MDISFKGSERQLEILAAAVPGKEQSIDMLQRNQRFYSSRRIIFYLIKSTT